MPAFNDLMRPAMYGSYHHITALAADGRDLSGEPQLETVVAGPLCESGDVFTQQEGGKVETRLLPAVAPGDYRCCTTPAPTAHRCLQTTTAARYYRKCCLIPAARA